MEWLEKQKLTCESFEYCFTSLLFTTGDMEKQKVQVPQQNEMLSLYCIALCFISKNEEYNQK